MQSYIAYLTARFLMALFRLLPRSLSIGMLNLAALLAYWVDVKHRRIARTNLTIAFPELTPRERDRIGWRSFQNTARNLVEAARLPLLSPQNIGSLVEYDSQFGLENYLLARRTGKPLLYLTGHFSAWELLPAAHALYGYPLSFVTRPLDNPPLERYVLRLREASGNKTVPKKNSTRVILEKLKQGEAVGILMDQNTSPQEGIFADLFGVPAATSTSLALFALRTHAVVLPGFLTPSVGGKYRIRFLEPLDLIRTGDMNRDVELNTRVFNRILEGIIRQYPETWLWGHKRWKNRPDENSPDLYELSPEDLMEFLKQRKDRR